MPSTNSTRLGLFALASVAADASPATSGLSMLLAMLSTPQILIYRRGSVSTPMVGRAPSARSLNERRIHSIVHRYYAGPLCLNCELGKHLTWECINGGCARHAGSSNIHDLRRTSSLHPSVQCGKPCPAYTGTPSTRPKCHCPPRGVRDASRQQCAAGCRTGHWSDRGRTRTCRTWGRRHFTGLHFLAC